MIHNPDDNESLRDMINGAVSREVNRQIVDKVAEMQQRQQVNTGQLRQLNQDYGDLKHRVEDLSEVVLGNAVINSPGLVRQVEKLTTSIDLLNKQIGKIQDYWVAVKWVFGVLIGLGVLNNDFIVNGIKAILGM